MSRPPEVKSSDMTCFVRAGVFTAIVDGLFAVVLAVFFYESTFTRLWQNVASTLFGPAAVGGGRAMVIAGLLMHVSVAFTWSAIFLLVARTSPAIRSRLARRGGVVQLAAVYGPFIWLVMSLVVIPLLVQRPPRINVRWWIQFAGHFPFVGLPLVASFTPLARDAEPITGASGVAGGKRAAGA